MHFLPCAGKPRGRQPKVPKHTVDSGGVINISDDSSSDSDGMDTDSNSSPDSLLDNDDVIFVNHTNGLTGRERDGIAPRLNVRRRQDESEDRV